MPCPMRLQKTSKLILCVALPWQSLVPSSPSRMILCCGTSFIGNYHFLLCCAGTSQIRLTWMLKQDLAGRQAAADEDLACVQAALCRNTMPVSYCTSVMVASRMQGEYCALATCWQLAWTITDTCLLHGHLSCLVICLASPHCISLSFSSGPYCCGNILASYRDVKVIGITSATLYNNCVVLFTAGE